MTHTFKPGQRVAALYSSSNGGTVLDFGARIVSVNPGGTSGTIHYADGETRSASLHGDFVSSMEPAYELAAVILTAHPELAGVDLNNDDNHPNGDDARRAVQALGSEIGREIPFLLAGRVAGIILRDPEGATPSAAAHRVAVAR